MRFLWQIENKNKCKNVFVSIALISFVMTAFPECKSPVKQFYTITSNKDSIGLYELFEVSIQIDKEVKNVYDKSEMEIVTEITSPDNELKKIDAFYFQEYEKTIVNGKETLTKKGNPCWKVRYTPTKTGRHSFTVNFKYKGKSYSSTKEYFDVSASPNKGFVRKGNRNYMQFDTKAPYFANGISVAWVDKFNTIAEYDYYFKKLKENGCNYSRIWLTEWNMPIEWSTNGLATGDVNGVGWYSQENSWKLDQVIDLARKNGLYLMITLGTYSDLLTTKGDWNEDKWHSNPYNIANGGMCEAPDDFFTNKKAISSYKKKLSYILSRWGYSTNIFAFELWNEYSSPIAWTKEISDYIKQIDPNSHLITTSLGFRKEDQNKDKDSIRWNLPNIDYTQSHLYGKGDVQNFTTIISQQNQMMVEKYHKPHLMAEFGIDYLNSDKKYDPSGNGIEIHNAAWTCIMTQSFGIAMTHWKEYVDTFNIYTHFKAISNFVEDIDWNANNFKEINTELRQTNDPYTTLFLASEGEWGEKTTKPIMLKPDGILTGKINRYIYGECSKTKSYYFTPEFLVDYPVKGNFILHIGQVSQRVPLAVFIDGKKVWEHQFFVQGVNGEWKSNHFDPITKWYTATFDKDYSIPIPKGAHTIRIENSGIDWIELKGISLENYQPKIEIFGLKGEKETICWVHNKESNWSNIGKKTIEPIANVQFTIHDLDDGQYQIQFWNTTSGTIVNKEIKQTINGSLKLSINQLTNDIAFKIKKL